MQGQDILTWVLETPRKLLPPCLYLLCQEAVGPGDRAPLACLSELRPFESITGLCTEGSADVSNFRASSGVATKPDT